MNNKIPYILILSLSIIIIGGFLKHEEQADHHNAKLQSATRLSYHAGFARAANTLKDQKDCTLATVPDVDSLFFLDVKID